MHTHSFWRFKVYSSWLTNKGNAQFVLVICFFGIITKLKSKSYEKFDDSLLDEPTPSKLSQSTPSTPDTSLQDQIKTMSNQLASLTSQFEEFKRKDKPSSSQKDPPISHEQGMCAPASQSRPEASKGELSDEDSNLPSRKRCRSRSPLGEADTH